MSNIFEINKNNIIENIPIMNPINNSKENAIQKVFKIESLSYLIATFLTFIEKKNFYSLNKKLNFFFRKSISQIDSKIIIYSPEIIERFPYLKIIDICGGKNLNFNFLKKKELQNLEQLNIKGVVVEDCSPISEFRQLKSLFLISNKINNIAFIKNLKNISVLDLGNNKLENIKT